MMPVGGIDRPERVAHHRRVGWVQQGPHVDPEGRSLGDDRVLIGHQERGRRLLYRCGRERGRGAPGGQVTGDHGAVDRLACMRSRPPTAVTSAATPSAQFLRPRRMGSQSYAAAFGGHTPG